MHPQAVRPSARSTVVVRASAQPVDRRAALGFVAVGEGHRAARCVRGLPSHAFPVGTKAERTHQPRTTQADWQHVMVTSALRWSWLPRRAFATELRQRPRRGWHEP
eukprot:366225-Chlamydomonas_euryale.AAC.7